MSRDEDPENLEGPGPTDEERRENARALSALSVPERFALMFGHAKPNPGPEEARAFFDTLPPADGQPTP